jgi:hypothetical protein
VLKVTVLELGTVPLVATITVFTVTGLAVQVLLV